MNTDDIFNVNSLFQNIQHLMLLSVSIRVYLWFGFLISDFSYLVILSKNSANGAFSAAPH